MGTTNVEINETVPRPNYNFSGLFNATLFDDSGNFYVNLHIYDSVERDKLLEVFRNREGVSIRNYEDHSPPFFVIEVDNRHKPKINIQVFS